MVGPRALNKLYMLLIIELDGMIVHGEAEKFGEEATVAYFKVLS
jgi:hypothetical protein